MLCRCPTAHEEAGVSGRDRRAPAGAPLAGRAAPAAVDRNVQSRNVAAQSMENSRRDGDGDPLDRVTLRDEQVDVAGRGVDLNPPRAVGAD